MKSCNLNVNTSGIKTITLDQGEVLGSLCLFALLRNMDQYYTLICDNLYKTEMMQGK